MKSRGDRIQKARGEGESEVFFDFENTEIVIENGDGRKSFERATRLQYRYRCYISGYLQLFFYVVTIIIHFRILKFD